MKIKALLRLFAKFVMHKSISVFKRKDNFRSGKYIVTLHSLVNKKKFCPNSVIEIDLDLLRSFILSRNELGYKFVSLDDYHGYGSNEKVISVTIDDGYYNNLSIGLSFFEEYQIPITIFITTEFINQKITPWWYVLESECSKDIGNYGFKVKHKTLIEKYAVFDYFRSKVYSESQMPAFISDKHKKTRGGIERFLNWSELEILANSPFVTIGAHTCNHKKLASIKCSEELRYEISYCKYILEQKLGNTICHFAIPFGKKDDFNEDVIKMAVESGYNYIYSTEKYDTKNTYGRFNLSYDEV